MTKSLQEVANEARKLLDVAPVEIEEPTSEQFVYKIRRPDGTFATGGSDGVFTNRGKIWPTIGALKNHLHQEYVELPNVSRVYSRKPLWNSTVYKNCVVVKYRLDEWQETEVKYFMESSKKGKK